MFVSAFGYEQNPLATLKLGWLLVMDESGEKPWLADLGVQRLQDKLLWGSDYPMILKHTDDYKELITQFLKAIDIGRYKYFPYPTPPIGKVDKQELLEKMVNTNPKKFLFGR